MNSSAGLDPIGHQQPDRQGECGDYLEIEKSLAPDPTDLLEIAHAGNANNDGQKNDWPHDHLDQPNEPLTQRTESPPPVGPDGADGHAEEDGDSDLKTQIQEKAFHAVGNLFRQIGRSQSAFRPGARGT